MHTYIHTYMNDCLTPLVSLVKNGITMLTTRIYEDGNYGGWLKICSIKLLNRVISQWGLVRALVKNQASATKIKSKLYG